MVVYVPFAIEGEVSYYTFGELTKFSAWVFTHVYLGHLVIFLIEWVIAFGLSIALWGFASYLIILGKRLVSKDSWKIRSI